MQRYAFGRDSLGRLSRSISEQWYVIESSSEIRTTPEQRNVIESSSLLSSEHNVRILVELS
jgi:hypothetical protein